MQKFFVLYMVPIAVIDQPKFLSPEDKKKGMDDWTEWMKMNQAMFVDKGAPLGKTKRVMKDGVSDVRNEVTGYSVIQAESHEAASKMFDGCPHLQFPGAYIEVLPIGAM